MSRHLDSRISDKLDDLLKQGLFENNQKEGEESILSQLRTLLEPHSLPNALKALEKLEIALRNGNIRSLPAYLGGVLRRISKDAADLQDHIRLHPDAQDILEEMYDLKRLERGELDSKSLSMLADRDPEYQVIVLSSFADRNLANVRNMAAFFHHHLLQADKDIKAGKLKLSRLDHHHDNRRPRQQPHNRDFKPRSPLRFNGDDYARGPPDLPSNLPHHDLRHQIDTTPNTAAGILPPLLHQPQYTQPAHIPVQPQPQAPQVFMQIPKHYGIEQAQWGIRVDEFQNLSTFAKYVHPASALRLQQLWDNEQNKLVSVLNEGSWESLAGLDAANGVKVVEECAATMQHVPDDIPSINALFIRIAARYPKRPNAPTLATIALAEAEATASALPALQQVPTVVPMSSMQAAVPVGHHMTQAPSSIPPSYVPPSSSTHPHAQSQPFASSTQSAPPPQYHYNQHVRLPGPCGNLTPRVQSEIDSIINQWDGLITLETFEGKAQRLLQIMREEQAIRALRDFRRHDPRQMKSPSGYLIGCIKQVDPEITDKLYSNTRKEQRNGNRFGGRRDWDDNDGPDEGDGRQFFRRRQRGGRDRSRSPLRRP